MKNTIHYSINSEKYKKMVINKGRLIEESTYESDGRLSL